MSAKAIELSAETFLREWAKQKGPTGAAAQLVLMQFEDHTSQWAEAEKLARQIHQALKQRERNIDHGLVGNLRCILDHVSRPYDPEPLG